MDVMYPSWGTQGDGCEEGIAGGDAEPRRPGDEGREDGQVMKAAR